MPHNESQIAKIHFNKLECIRKGNQWLPVTKENARVNTVSRKHSNKENVRKTFNFHDSTALMTREAAQSEVCSMAPHVFNARCPSSTALVPLAQAVYAMGLLSCCID